MENYKKFFDLSLDIMCIATPDGRLERVNGVFTECLGYPHDDLLSMRYFDLIHPDDLKASERELTDLGSGHLTKNFENRCRHADRSYRIISWSASADSESNLIFAMGREITNQVVEQDRLGQIETALIADKIISETDRRGDIIFLNDEYCRLSGYSREELLGKNHRLLNSAYHPKQFFDDLWQKVSAGEVWSGLIRNQKKNGDYFYLQTLIIPMFDMMGTISSYLSVCQDQTNSVMHEGAFTRTLEILNETSAIAKVGGWELDVASGELTWTDETFKILEVEKQHGQKPMLPEGLQLFIPEHIPLVEEAVNRAMTTGEPYALEVQARTAKGNVLWVYTNGKANYADGKIVSLSGTIQDIQARKTAEIKYEEERQKSLHAAKMVSLGELAASMAHDINNPLGVILGYADLLIQTNAVAPSHVKKVESIKKASARIQHIVQSLRKYSRTDSEKKFENCNLQLVIEEAIELARPRLKNESVEVRLQNSVIGEIFCNHIEIEQVLLNLINNSIDAVSRLDDKWIAIETIAEPDKYCVSITDSGLGIASELQYRIFEPFFTTKTADRGTGLGLSIIVGILEEHDAQIDYLLNNGHTCFKLSFNKA